MRTVALAFTILFKLFMITYSALNISKFGLITHKYSNSGPDASFNLTLYWHSQIIICQFINPPNQKNTSYTCNDTSNIIILNQQEPYQYKFKIDYNVVNVFRIDALFVVDSNQNSHLMNTFCGAKQFYYWDGLTETLCNAPWTDRFNYSYIELDINTAKLTTIYVSFINTPGINNIDRTPGIIQPESIKSFGIKTSDHSSASTTNTITIILYWDMYMYSCSFIPDTNNQIYECNERMFIKSISSYNQVMYFLTIENHNSNAVYIDHLFVNDNSQLSYQYTFDTFCTNTVFNPTEYTVNLQAASCDGYTFDKADPNTANIVQFAEFCVGSTDCVSKLAIDFALELMEKVDLPQSGFAYPVSLNATFNPTLTPTTTPISTSVPTSTSNPSSNPTSNPTINPTITQTQFPSSQPFVTPSMNSTQSDIVTTIDEGKEQILSPNHTKDFTWLFIVISLSLIVGLVFALILCWLYVKRLKKEQMVNTNRTSGQELQLEDAIDLQQVRSASASLDITEYKTSNVNKGTTTGMVMSEDEGDHIGNTMNYHRNTNVGDEGEEQNTGSNHDVNTDEFVEAAQNDEEIIGDDEMYSTPIGSMN